MKKSIIISIVLVIIGCFLNIYDIVETKNKRKLEDKKIEIFFEKQHTDIPKTNLKNDYIAVLEIPKIRLKKGLFSPKSARNSVDENIEILHPVKMPDEEDHTFILASHSGTSNVSYFRNLNRLRRGDIVYVYYKSIKYKYVISTYYYEEKTGNITVKNKTKNNSIIVLTTCKPVSYNKQLTYIGVLKSKNDNNKNEE